MARDIDLQLTVGRELTPLDGANVARYCILHALLANEGEYFICEKGDAICQDL